MGGKWKVGESRGGEVMEVRKSESRGEKVMAKEGKQGRKHLGRGGKA